MEWCTSIRECDK